MPVTVNATLPPLIIDLYLGNRIVHAFENDSISDDGSHQNSLQSNYLSHCEINLNSEPYFMPKATTFVRTFCQRPRPMLETCHVLGT